MRRALIALLICALLALNAGCAEVATTANVAYRAAENPPVEVSDVTPAPAASPAPTLDMPQSLSTSANTAAPMLPVLTPTPVPTEEPTPTPSPTPGYEVEPIDDKKAYLNASSANLREGPTTESAILAELEKYTALVVTGETEDWYRVVLDGVEGFLLAEFVEYGAAPTPTPSFTVRSMDDRSAYVSASAANLREGPGTEYDIRVELERYDELTVTGRSGDWYRVEYGRRTGFILGELIEFGAVPTATPKPTATPAPSATATPKPTATQTPAATSTPASGTSTSGVNAHDYFSDTSRFSAEELLLIAQVVQEEAKGTDVEARAAVANSIYNRYISSQYPNTIEGVIFQKNQYTVADDEDEIRSVKPVERTIAAVTQIFVNGDTFLPEDVVFFRQASRGTSWGDKRVYYATYGGNAFFRSLY